MSNIVIGIEGEVASGKTSTCRSLVKMIDNSTFIDGGAIYRGIILALKQSKVDLRNLFTEKNVNALDIMKKLKVEFLIKNHETIVCIDGNEVNNNSIQNAQNAMDVSKMASLADNSSLFMFARHIIDEYKKKYNIIVSARDLVAIYPDMTCHIYITANLEERVKRRYNEYNGKYSIAEIRKMIVERDRLHEKAGFNLRCAKSITIDVTECKSAEESAKKIYEKLKEMNIL